MKKFVAEIKYSVFKLKKNTVRWIRSIITEEQAIDWRGIDETRCRLTRMRFRNGDAFESTLCFAPSTGELSRTFRTGIGSCEAELMRRWFATIDPVVNAKELEKSLRETIYKRKTEHVIDDDWTYRQSNDHETLLLPNIDYAINPDPIARQERRVAGLLTAAAH